MSQYLAKEFDNIDKILCEYGCGQLAKYKFKKGKVCCSENYNSCPSVSKQRSLTTKERHPIKIKPELIKPELCSYGCGRPAIHQFQNGKGCCCETYKSCPSVRFKKGKSSKGRPSWNKGLTKETDERVLNLTKKSGETLKVLYEDGTLVIWNKGKHDYLSEESRKKMGHNKGKPGYWAGKKRGPQSVKWRLHIGLGNIGKKRTPEQIKNISIGRTGIFPNDETRRLQSVSKKKSHQDPNSGYNKPKYREYLRNMCLNGHAIVMLKAQTNPSKPEVMLRDMVKEIFPDCEFQHKVFNYALDVAIPEYKIAIEFDGYYHFNTPENIEYHKNRQKRIEDEGWVFYRVTMFDRFPTLEEVKEKLFSLKGQ
jgi:very-short-patch-repair endonuclease